MGKEDRQQSDRSEGVISAMRCCNQMEHQEGQTGLLVDGLSASWRLGSDG